MPHEPSAAPDGAMQASPPDLPEGTPPLTTFYLYIANGCNLRCRHCWIVPHFTDGKPDPGDFVDVDALRGAVREARTLGLNSAKLTGGEPMLHPRFLDIVDLLTAEGLSLNMETNGTLMTAETARHLKYKTSLAFSSISLDGVDARTHDTFRGVAGAFDAAMKGLSNLVDAGFTNTQVIMSVHRGNRAQVESVVHLAAERGAASVKLNPVTRTGRGAVMHERGEAMDFTEHMDLARYVYDELSPRAPIAVVLKVPAALLPLSQLKRAGAGCGDCNVRNILGILGTNEYALCGIGQTHREFVYGRLGTDSVREIWLTNPTILHLRRALADVDAYPGICRRCIFARACRTGCVVNNFVESGRLVAAQGLCAEAYARGFFPAARAQRRSGRAERPGESAESETAGTQSGSAPA